MRYFRKHSLHCGDSVLDAQQSEAVVACEDAQLVLASAGSGKTMSLLAKVEYLHTQLGIAPEQILVISFTKKTVLELIERCAVKGVKVRTFHGLGNNILQASSNELGNRRLLSESEIAAFIRATIDELRTSNDDFARLLNDYILLYYSAPKNPGNFVNFAARISFNRQYIRCALGAPPNILIRSKEEELLANWLWMHSVEYVFRKQYSGTEVKYKPVFTIGDIYVDVVDVNEKGRSSRGAEYLREIKWCRKLHKEHGDKYIELYSCYWNNDRMYVRFAEELARHGVCVTCRPEAEIFQKILDDKIYNDEFTALLNNFQTFLSLHKNAQYTMQEVRERVLKMPEKYSEKRARIFLQMYSAIYAKYEEYLDCQRAYDFADMINHAARIVREDETIARGYRYILLDEVQDLSRNRLMLIKAILRKNPACKLFAVGDDWQSIYRFAGSDLTLVQNLAEIFDLETRKSFIETTHRFGQPTIRLSCDFIRRNPAQSFKNVSNKKARPTPIYVILNNPQYKFDDTESLNIILESLIKERGFEKVAQKELQIIARYNHDIARLKASEFLNITHGSQDGVDKVVWHSRTNPGYTLTLEFCSMHKSKGITRDIVIVLNMNSDLMGMPAMRENDPILDSLLARGDHYPFAEERRLFYVAITRAREATYLIANSKNPSPFIFEISDELKSSYGKLCPKCETGEIVRRHGKFGDFEYCANYRYGCNYLRKGL